jgi:hypothetical protein
MRSHTASDAAARADRATCDGGQCPGDNLNTKTFMKKTQYTINKKTWSVNEMQAKKSQREEEKCRERKRKTTYG